MHLLRISLPSIAVLLALPIQAIAGQVRADGDTVVINGVPTIHIETPFHGFSPEERARRLAGKLGSIAFWGQIDIKGDDQNRTLFVSGESVLTITPEEAAAQNTTPADLAVSLAARIKSALDLPPLRVSDNFVRIPAGGAETVKIVGSEIAHATAETSASSIASVARSTEGVKITGRSVGHATVSVMAGKDQENIEVDVLPYAANFPQKVDGFVTGAPTTAVTVQGVIEEALKTKLAGVPNVHWNFGKFTAEALPTGNSETYTVKTWAAAPESFPSSGNVEITVKNSALPLYTDQDLWYSNDPETIRQPGPLFSDSLKAGASARLLYHHVNGTMQDMFVRVEAINDGDDPVRVEIIPGDSKPNQDPVRAGVNAADQFIQNWMTGSGEVITVPPKSAFPISLRRLAPGQTISGLCSLRQIDGSTGLLVRTDAFPPLTLDDKWTAALYSSTPWREVGAHPINDYDRAPCEASPLIYPDPYRRDQMSYQVGGRFGFLRIGQRPIARQDSDGVLDGNFGVIYNIQANLSNPTAEPTDVELVLEASAGYSGGIFIVDGSYIKTKLLEPKETARVALFHLPPGGVQMLHITTLPISGSSYPATLMLRPITTGGLGAPNGMLAPGRA